jgi:hypothetical protein
LEVVELNSFVLNGTDMPIDELFNPWLIQVGDTVSGVLSIAESATYGSGTTFALSFQTVTQRGYSENVVLP